MQFIGIKSLIAISKLNGRMAELVDAAASKAAGFRSLRVRVPFRLGNQFYGY